ncbi:MAG: hypothetical protein H6Q68_2877 [Firmicutes bacterium]|nr:hypothetical protein [Bacillota bacterium]
MMEDKKTNWLTMRQVITKTGMKATTISRYKDEFPEYVISRLDGQLLEFDEDSVPVLKFIYELYRSRSEGRRTTERVRDILQKKYGLGQPPIIDIAVVTTTPQQLQEQQLMSMISNHLIEQDNRMTTIEFKTNEILEKNNEILAGQLEIKHAVNERLALMSEIAATRREEKQQGFWSKLFGF